MTVGAQLQQARRERKLSLADVTKATKIQPWVLESMEADQLQDMMSPIYVKGFLATYAKVLHLNPESLISQLQWSKPEPESVQPAPETPSIPVARQWPSAQALRRGLVGLAAAAAVVGIVSAHPVQRLRQWRPTLAQRLVKAKKAEGVQRADAKLATIAPVLGGSVGVAKPIPPAIPLAQPLELLVAARRTTWIQVRADGKLLTQQRLQRGANERWTAKKQFEIVIAKPSEVEVNLNGEPISSFAIAHRGRLMITHRGITQLPDEES